MNSNNKFALLLGLIIGMPIAAKGIDITYYIIVFLIVGGLSTFLMSRKDMALDTFFHPALIALLAINAMLITLPRSDVENLSLEENEIDLSGVWNSDDGILELKIVDNDEVHIKDETGESVEYVLMNDDNAELVFDGYGDYNRFNFKVLEHNLNLIKAFDLNSNKVYTFKKQ